MLVIFSYRFNFLRFCLLYSVIFPKNNQGVRVNGWVTAPGRSCILGGLPSLVKEKAFSYCIITLYTVCRIYIEWSSSETLFRILGSWNSVALTTSMKATTSIKKKILVDEWSIMCIHIAVIYSSFKVFWNNV